MAVDSQVLKSVGVRHSARKCLFWFVWAVSQRVKAKEAFNDGYSSKRTADNKDLGRRG
jgi:hypothetical protein